MSIPSSASLGLSGWGDASFHDAVNSVKAKFSEGEVLRSALRKDMLQLYLLSREPFTLLQDRFLLPF
jgi:hypothetical protein